MIREDRHSSDIHAANSVVTYRRRGRCAVITINRPEKRNALSLEVIAKLRAALEEARTDDYVSVVVLTGAGGRCFSAGGDLAEMRSADRDLLDAHNGRGALGEVFQQLWEMGKPTIARVEGFALAGGFGLALACDLVLASDDSVFGTPEVKRGLFPYMISVPMLRAMPAKTALRLILTGERVDAQQALSMGFLTEIAPRSQLDALVDRYVRTLCEASPQAVQVGRGAFYRVLDAEVGAKLEHLKALLTLTLGTEDAAEGLAAFLGRRNPSWYPEEPST